MSGSPFSEEDKQFMSRAFELARQGRTSPNPMVGCVVVKNGKIIGEGYHHKAGEPHAEINALNQVQARGESPEGSTIYVTLEPCAHQGRTPPCASRLAKEKPAQVIIANKDPNPLVMGKGEAILRAAGIHVRRGLMEKEGLEINRAFFKYIRTHRPLVTIKTAVTIDGKIATSRGDSKWITGPQAREYVHRMRQDNDAIMVGIGTVKADNPSLTVRLEGKETAPWRIIADSRLEIPPDARVVSDAFARRTIIAVCEGVEEKKVEDLRFRGVTVIFAGKGPRVDLDLLLEELGRREILSLMVEGGGEINASFFARGLVDRINLFMAPKIVGGKDAPSFTGGTGAKLMKEAFLFSLREIKRFGDDLLLEYVPAFHAEKEESCLQE